MDSIDADTVQQITADLVKYRTTDDRPDEIDACLDYIASYFDDDMVVRRYEDDDVPSLVISFDETTTPEILLHGHIDVVPGDDNLFEPVVDGNRMYGRGTADMKAGVASFMAVMDAFADTANPPDAALMVVSDEELGGFNGTQYLLEEEDYHPSFAVSAEPNAMDGYMDIVTDHKGLLELAVTVPGESAHASEPWNGDNAIENAMERYQQIAELFDDDEPTWNSTLNLGKFEGGDALNQVPDTATYWLDIRYTDQYPASDILQDVTAMDDVDVTVLSKEPSMQTDKENPYVQRLHSELQNVTAEAGFEQTHYTSDARFFTANDIPGVVFGPEGYNLHQSDEYVVLDSIGDYLDTVQQFVSTYR